MEQLSVTIELGDELNRVSYTNPINIRKCASRVRLDENLELDVTYLEICSIYRSMFHLPWYVLSTVVFRGINSLLDMSRLLCSSFSIN